MSDTHQHTSSGSVGLTRWAILAIAIVGIIANWLLYNLAPPHGSGSVFGYLIGILAGGYIAVLVYDYVSSTSTVRGG